MKCDVSAVLVKLNFNFNFKFVCFTRKKLVFFNMTKRKSLKDTQFVVELLPHFSCTLVNEISQVKAKFFGLFFVLLAALILLCNAFTCFLARKLNYKIPPMAAISTAPY